MARSVGVGAAAIGPWRSARAFRRAIESAPRPGAARRAGHDGGRQKFAPHLGKRHTRGAKTCWPAQLCRDDVALHERSFI